MGAIKKSRLSPTEAIKKIQHYCAYQERSHQEVKRKLYSYGLYTSEVDELLSTLITDGFLNEARFARAFAGGKFRIKYWGWKKIEQALKSFGLTERCIQDARSELDPEAYRQTLRKLLSKKLQEKKFHNEFQDNQRAAQYAIRKGYEPELVWETLKNLTDG